VTAKKKREFSDNEVRLARAFCAGVGGLLVLVGVKLATSTTTSVPPEVAWGAAAIGAVIALVGVLAPRDQCVRAATWILDIAG
jgi:hypothetical protein